MRYLTNLRVLKKVSAVAVAVGIAVCLVPNPAQAQRARWSGSSTNTSVFNFDIDTAVRDQLRHHRKGFFPGAIQVNFTGPQGYTNSTFCGFDPCQGDVTVTKLMTDASGNVLGLVDANGNEIGLNRLQQLLPTINFSNHVLRYDITFPHIPSNITHPSAHKFIFFIPSHDSSLIHDLSGLTQFNDIGGIIPIDVSSDLGGNNGGTFHIHPVP